jgi:hypothetical protein
MLQESRDEVAAGEVKFVSCAAEQSKYFSICTVAPGPFGDLPFTSKGPLAEMVPFHSTQAAGSKFPSKVLWTRFGITPEGPSRFKKKLGSAVPEKGSMPQPVSQPPNPTI